MERRVSLTIDHDRWAIPSSRVRREPCGIHRGVTISMRGTWNRIIIRPPHHPLWVIPRRTSLEEVVNGTIDGVRDLAIAWIVTNASELGTYFVNLTYHAPLPDGSEVAVDSGVWDGGSRSDLFIGSALSSFITGITHFQTPTLVSMGVRFVLVSGDGMATIEVRVNRSHEITI